MMLLVDINETLIRTGPTDIRQALDDVNGLYSFRRALERLSTITKSLHVVLTTGNTFEYARRVEEPLGIANIPNVRLTVVSENGLICRAINHGYHGWHQKPSPATMTQMHHIASLLRDHLSTTAYLQGNESRITIKPQAGHFSPEEIQEALGQICNRGAEHHSAWGMIKTGKVAVYSSPHYIDIDPTEVLEESSVTAALDKYSSSRRLIRDLLPPGDHILLAFGDSQSDVGLMRAALESNGVGYQMRNSLHRWECAQAVPTSRSYAHGVAHTLNQHTGRLRD